MGGGSPERGNAKAASKLVHVSPASKVVEWTLVNGCLEAHITLRAKRHPLAFQMQVAGLPRSYSVTPSRGTIEAGESVTATIRYRSRTHWKSRRASATTFWTDLRILVRQLIPAEDMCEEEAALFEYEEDTERRIEREKLRSRYRGSHDFGKTPNGVTGSPTTFSKTVNMQPIVASDELCSICCGQMDVRKHVSGIPDEKLFALRCGHIYHEECLRRCAKSTLAECPCGCGQYVNMNCAICRRPMTNLEYSTISGRRRDPFSEFYIDADSVDSAIVDASDSVASYSSDELPP